MSKSYSHPGSRIVNSYDGTPRFRFFLYNKKGRIYKTQMSIHEIQKMLLRQTKQFGWSPLSDLIKSRISMTSIDPPPVIVNQQESLEKEHAAAGEISSHTVLSSLQSKRTLPTTTTARTIISRPGNTKNSFIISHHKGSRPRLVTWHMKHKKYRV